MTSFRLLSMLPLLFLLMTDVQAQSTIYFYRLKNMIMSNTPIDFAVNDTAKFSLENGSYYKMQTNATSIDIVTSVNNIGVKNVKLQNGKTYYVDLRIKNLTTINLTLEDDYAGKPAIERLEADKKAKELSTANLKTIKVLETEPLPAASPDQVKIYLFRPFDAVGAFKYVKISDGEVIYDMKNNTAHVITTDKDNITFSTIQEGIATSNTSLNVKLQKGKVYYVAVVRSGGAIVLSETKEEYARIEMKLDQKK
jgi:hypothetical protein